MSTRRIVTAMFALASGVHASQPVANEREDWRTTRLPGFSVELPAGHVVAQGTFPPMGIYQATLPGDRPNAWLQLTWVNSARSFDSWMGQTLPMLLAREANDTSGKKLRLVQRGEAWSLAIIDIDGLPLGLGRYRCDDKFEIEIKYARFRQQDPEVADLHRILDSVKCAVTPENRARVRAALRVPASLVAVSDEPAQHLQSRDGEHLIVSLEPGDVQADPARFVTLSERGTALIFGTTVADLSTVSVGLPHTAGAPKETLLRMHVPSDPGIVYSGASYCAKLGLSLKISWFAPRETDALAVERFHQVDCPQTP